MWRNKFLLLGIIASLLIVSACTDPSSGDKGKKAKEQVLTTVNHVTSEPASLDPLKATDSQSGEVLTHVMEGLVRTDAKGEPQPGMAEKWEVSADNLTFTFHLRDAKWTNGDPVTAHDFEFQWKRMLDPKNAGEADYAYQLYYLKNGQKYQQGKAKAEDVGVKAIDDKTLQVTLEKPTPFFVSLTGFYALFPTNKNVVEKNPDWAKNADSYVGNGPFKLKTWAHDSKIEIVKNENYWNKNKVQLTQINFPMVGEEQTAYQMFLSKKINYLGTIPTDLVPKLLKEGKAKSTPIMGTYMYMFNVEKAPFNNAKIRKAFSLAIDREKLVKNVTQGGQAPATGWVPWEFNDPVANKPFYQARPPYLPSTANPDEAKKLLAEGLKELGMTELPEVTLDYNTSEAHKKIAEAVQQMWKENLGVEVKMRNSEFKVYLDKTKAGDFQVARMGWLADYVDPMTFADYYLTDGGNNDTNWGNPEYDKLIAEAKSTADQKVRMEKMHQAEAILMDEMPVAPLYFYTINYMMDDKLKNVIHDVTGHTDYTYAYIEE
ncbi:peptide ABC transporter substrate-binding protein [Paenactinomyces guangxiensis]|uniref:Peptide ABC transporter substrate-binding protein n=1 Tax=Paenactinomyces guangxiensis TaxID=1490290 RepID=A0A7W2A7I8_9BACL|nr:peptide ABC transporter substrate-binding protein [Paenactinomyces guangxiensis]MBH8591626.1 peptide ABC transporter substrate-binding protein [Paenactinomyces guangxiensis]